VQSLPWKMHRPIDALVKIRASLSTDSKILPRMVHVQFSVNADLSPKPQYRQNAMSARRWGGDSFTSAKSMEIENKSPGQAPLLLSPSSRSQAWDSAVPLVTLSLEENLHPELLAVFVEPRPELALPPVHLTSL
jgi:hypothetical protein